MLRIEQLSQSPFVRYWQEIEMANDLGKPPFQRHIRYYLLLKIVMIAFAVLLALQFFSARGV
jgi:hypothetical protein